jgi:polysaccharide pyruvyl transferase WcaK-like protein
MRKEIHILCPEYVPLENKGEEAIIQGTIDTVFEESDYIIHYHLLDTNIHEYQFVNGFHMHPNTLFYNDWRSREFGFDGTYYSIYSSLCSLVRNGLNKFFPRWIRKPHRQIGSLIRYLKGQKQIPNRYIKSIELLKKIDYVIAGHNGGLDEYVCHSLLLMKKELGWGFSIFGSSMKPKVKQKELLNIYHAAFKLSDFTYVRNPIGFNWAIKNFPDCEFTLGPDPAFNMIPKNETEVSDLLNKLGLHSLKEGNTILVTTAEPAPIARHSFDNSYDKIDAHREFLSNLLKMLINETDHDVVFLPHTIGPNKRMDDRLIASDVIKRAEMGGNPRVRLLEEDLTARELKAIIRLGRFLIAERVHSIIGAVGVCTPFLCLGSVKDTRVTGIIQNQLGLEDWVYYLNNPSLDEIKNIVVDRLNNLKRDIGKLEVLNLNNKKTLQKAGEVQLKHVLNDFT